MQKTPCISSIFSKYPVASRESDPTEGNYEHSKTQGELDQESSTSKKAKRMSYFNNDWLWQECYSSWLRPTSGNKLGVTMIIIVMINWYSYISSMYSFNCKTNVSFSIMMLYSYNIVYRHRLSGSLHTRRLIHYFISYTQCVGNVLHYFL